MISWCLLVVSCRLLVVSGPGVSWFSHGGLLVVGLVFMLVVVLYQRLEIYAGMRLAFQALVPPIPPVTRR